jgi:hypothetical protein
MGLSDIWDYIVDGFDYLIHFEWFGDAKDWVVDIFSNLGEFSTYGLGFGICSCIFLLFTKQWMLDPFLSYMKPVSRIVVSSLTFIVTFIACYIMGSHFENS